MFFGNWVTRGIASFLLIMDWLVMLSTGKPMFESGLTCFITSFFTIFAFILGEEAYENGEEWAKYYWVDGLICFGGAIVSIAIFMHTKGV